MPILGCGSHSFVAVSDFVAVSTECMLGPEAYGFCFFLIFSPKYTVNKIAICLLNIKMLFGWIQTTFYQITQTIATCIYNQWNHLLQLDTA